MRFGMLFAGAWSVSAWMYAVMQKWMPSNRILRLARQRTALKWGLLVSLAGALVYTALYGVAITGAQNGVEILYVPALLFFISGVKFVVFGPISLVLLLRRRADENRLVTDFLAQQTSESRAKGQSVQETTRPDRHALLESIRA